MRGDVWRRVELVARIVYGVMGNRAWSAGRGDEKDDVWVRKVLDEGSGCKDRARTPVVTSIAAHRSRLAWQRTCEMVVVLVDQTTPAYEPCWLQSFESNGFAFFFSQIAVNYLMIHHTYISECIGFRMEA